MDVHTFVHCGLFSLRVKFFFSYITTTNGFETPKDVYTPFTHTHTQTYECV